jgi:tRNA modification GTPase
MARTYLDTGRPIFALATAPGRAALAVIRVSGTAALELCDRCFSGQRPLSEARGYTMLHGFLVDPCSGERVDEVVAAVFRGPRSFTGEDSVEFSCHGSPAVAGRALAALELAGLSPALPGEFTFRAFINGKTDLVRAEAVAELAGAQCESARADALARLSGTLSAEYAALRDAMLDLLAEIEARLDYPEEEGPDDGEAGGIAGSGALEPAAESAKPWLATLASCEARLERLSGSYLGGKLRQDGALVVVAGRPNAGKSSLFNLITREERAIVSSVPGTTRDWLEAWIEIGGYAVRLVDTAGLRRVEEGIEAEGVRRSLDVIVYLADGRAGISPEDEEFIANHPDAIKLWNKMDAADCMPAPQGGGWLPISAKKGDRLDALESALKERLDALAAGLSGAAPKGGRAALSGEVRLASARQKSLVDRCLEAVRRAGGGAAAGLPLDAVALDVREAADCLGEITGEIAGEEVFDRIFGSFCLGK